MTCEHSYPHCWRCHKPVIFRATEQWFIGMETPMLSPKTAAKTTFRQRALDEIKEVTWDPAWGEERISEHDRDAAGLVHLAADGSGACRLRCFCARGCHEPLNDEAINKSVVELFAQEGADAWYSARPWRAAAEGHGVSATAAVTSSARRWTSWMCGSSRARAGTRCWIVEPELHWPADLYTEGGDQHRGWFHSSLLTSVGIARCGAVQDGGDERMDAG